MSDLVLWLANGISSPDVRERISRTEAVTDVLNDLDPAEIVLLTHLLVAARRRETDAEAQESQLNALGELKSRLDLPREVLAPLRYVPIAGVEAGQREHLAWLLDDEEE